MRKLNRVKSIFNKDQIDERYEHAITQPNQPRDQLEQACSL